MFRHTEAHNASAPTTSAAAMLDLFGGRVGSWESRFRAKVSPHLLLCP